MLPSSRWAPTGSVMAVKITGMSLSSAALKQATAALVAMPTIRSTSSAENIWPIWVAWLSSKLAFW